MLSFQTIENESELLLAVGERLHEYLNPKGEEIEGLEIRECIPRYRIPRGSMDCGKISSIVERAGWHIQIYQSGQPKWYARALFDGKWKVIWVGKAWLAQDVRAGIQWLENDSREVTSEVKLLSSRLFEFSSFWLKTVPNMQVVVSASDRLQKKMKLLEWTDEGTIKNALISAFGSKRGRGGISHHPKTIGQS